MKTLAATTKAKVTKFIETFADKVFIGAATAYLAQGGQLNTIKDLKVVGIAGALAGVTWALAYAKSNSGQ